MSSDRSVSLPGVFILLIGILVILTPWYIFPVCEHYGDYVITQGGMQLPMTCGWTARAEAGLGALLIVAGGMVLARNTRETLQAAGIFSMALGVLVVLTPMVLIGMCKAADHPCRVLTLPGLVLLGIAAIIAGGYLVWKRESDA